MIRSRAWAPRAAWALVAAVLMVARPVLAADATEALLGRIDAASREVKSLSGEFVQASRVKLFKQELRSRGRFHFQRPRRVRWEYLDPDPSTLVVDGEKATLVTPGAPPQVFDLARDATMRTVFDQIFLWFGEGSLAKARADYDLAAGGTDTAPTLSLTPHAGSTVGKAFARIELRFDQRLLLKTILLREPSGDEKQIDFTKVERNGKLPEKAFIP